MPNNINNNNNNLNHNDDGDGDDDDDNGSPSNGQRGDGGVTYGETCPSSVTSAKGSTVEPPSSRPIPGRVKRGLAPRRGSRGVRSDVGVVAPYRGFLERSSSPIPMSLLRQLAFSPFPTSEIPPADCILYSCRLSRDESLSMDV